MKSHESKIRRSGTFLHHWKFLVGYWIFNLLPAIRNIAALTLVLGLCSCTSPYPSTYVKGHPRPPVRFLITFDDGPSGWQDDNPTLSIMNQLATNDVQNNVCAIFFTQSVHPRGGGTPLGRDIMHQLNDHGHILGIHSVSPQGHVAHPTIPTNQLTALLIDAKKIIKDMTGADPLFLRSPYGTHNPATRTIYKELGLNFILADITARDGVIYGFNGSPTRRRHMGRYLDLIRQKLDKEPAGSAPYPVTISFHDVNPYTARHMTEYLHIIIEEAERVGLSMPAKPFFDNREEATTAAIQRSMPPP